jgi:hypothetical protein
MPQGQKSLCAVVALALLVALVLSGCSGTESGPALSTAHGGVVAAVAGGLAREDDEAELKEIVEHETTSEERQELREELEEREQAQGQEPEQQPEQGQGSEQQPEQGQESEQGREPEAEQEQGHGQEES